MLKIQPSSFVTRKCQKITKLREIVNDILGDNVIYDDIKSHKGGFSLSKGNILFLTPLAFSELKQKEAVIKSIIYFESEFWK